MRARIFVPIVPGWRGPDALVLILDGIEGLIEANSYGFLSRRFDVRLYIS